ncbi:MAG: hypothetical protein AUF65_01950 [Chloroflexi bacterium 13_1_20CM_50_12]|nr:MAG: hypothetical protein AUF65_01950 [Chloroflexi bacterium 13_1_20CM_50_12]
MAERLGQQLGNYLLTRLLGEGGFAEVYLGEHIHLGTVAAVKVLHAQLTTNDVAQFNNEARTIAHLEHPHIVRVLDYGVENKTPFLVLIHAANGSLRQRHPKGTVLSLGEVVSYIQQLAPALQYAHDEKLIHRDIKPENMLLGRNNEVLLSDFGIAVAAQSSNFQSAKDMAGTISYMAPEQIQGKPRRASDQYSLGIVVYEWLCGECPFRGSFVEVASQHVLVPPPPLREKNSSIAPEIEQVVMKALEKESDKRYASVQAFATALEQASQMPQPYTIRQLREANNQTYALNPTLRLVTENPRLETPSNINTAIIPAPQHPTSVFTSLIKPLLPHRPPVVKRAQPSHSRVWQGSFLIIFSLISALTVFGSLLSFNIPNPYGSSNPFPPGFDHAVEFGLSVVFISLVLIASTFVRNTIAKAILFVSALAMLLSAFAFLVQTIRDVQLAQPVIISAEGVQPVQSPFLSTIFNAGQLGQFFTIGLVAAALVSLVWLTRPYLLPDRIVLLVVFGIAAICAILQTFATSGDSDVTSHIYLLFALIALIQGVLIAVQTERVRMATK